MPIIEGMVSVIVPTHNRAQYLKLALLSILKQSYELVEIIVIANGCNDETENAVNEIKSHTQAAIIFLNFTEVLGGAKARNIGLDKARGEYIAFLDDDDTWHPDKLKTQIQLLNEKKLAIVSTSYFYVYIANDQSERTRAVGALLGRCFTLEDLYYENILGSFSFCLTKKSYIGKSRINENLTALQDWDLWFKILLNTELPAYISPAQHAYYRLYGHRISSCLPQVIKAQKYFLQYWKNTLNPPSIAYHKMRTRCFELRTQPNIFYRCIVGLGLSIKIVKTMFYSPYRRNIYVYIHYILLSIIDVDAFYMKLWQRKK